MLGDVIARRRTDDDLAGCVRALEGVHRLDGYPAWWPADPAGWLSPSGCAAAWVIDDEVTGSILGHVCVVRGLDDPMVASLTGVSTNRLASVSRLFVSPVARGRGLRLGTFLLAAVSSWTSVHDLQLMLDVVDDGAPAKKLYERLGWRLGPAAGRLGQSAGRTTARVHPRGSEDAKNERAAAQDRAGPAIGRRLAEGSGYGAPAGQV